MYEWVEQPAFPAEPIITDAYDPTTEKLGGHRTWLRSKTKHQQSSLSLERKQQKMERSRGAKKYLPFRSIASTTTNPINIDFDTQALSKGKKKAGSVVETDPQPTIVAGRGRRQSHNPKSLAVSCYFQRF
jgi:hypothetical protein